ncbi:hypothetical protein M378DRAFT_15571 [Amanita muscaria Koide BX008]|uniref:Uncharacterized protein n=1 Tax=Amanita muscaria (strain Koide BX008) TaxID=946122 RepID=A0A0C2SW92_AMAMK|nr:hypothetical protein M378DRAFT_15571 [Amanita muscaria Koide BX008]
MVDYEIVIRMTSEQARDKSKWQYSICFAKPTGDGASVDQPVYVIASSYQPGAYSTVCSFTWSENYAMAANDKAYKPGGAIETTRTKPREMELQNLLMVEGWSESAVAVKHNSQAVHKDSFGFNPVKDDGVYVLYLRDIMPGFEGTEWQGSPCYTSRELFLHGPNNVEQIAPSPSAVIFFGRDLHGKPAHTGSVWKASNGTVFYPITLDFKDGKKCTLTHNLDSPSGWDVEYSE